MLQAFGFDGVADDPFSLKSDHFPCFEADVHRGDLKDAVGVSTTVLVGDDVTDLLLEIT